jgi:hypothetical protein
VEPNVKFWLVFVWTGANGYDDEGGIATSSTGVNAIYLQTPQDGRPVWWTKDASHTKYVGAFNAASEYVLRSANVVDVFEDAMRFGSPPKGCQTVPLIEVHCRGTTTLGK